MAVPDVTHMTCTLWWWVPGGQESRATVPQQRLAQCADRPQDASVSGYVRPLTCGGMHRPIKFEHTRFLGDKRTQLVYDLDEWTDEAVIDEIVAAEVGLCFGPDTLAEARNRGYTLATPGKTRRHLKPRA
jgi:hypothetical protein